MKISAVIITKDEEKRIERCLDSLMGVADEIIVVDSGSTDQTEAICLSKGATFVQWTWEGYAANKNYGNSLAQYPYILSVDADEVLTEELRNAILEVKPSLTGAYEFKRLANYCGQWIRHCGWYPDPKVRLFPKEKARWSGGYVHERLLVDKDLAITRLSGDLLHYTINSIGEHISRINRYSSLSARELYDQGTEIGLFKLVFAPLSRFFRMFFFRGGFRDGYFGFMICWLSANARFLRFAKVRELHKKAYLAAHKQA